MNLQHNIGGADKAGAVDLGGSAQAAPVHPHYEVGAVGFGPAWTMEDSMAASIVRLEQENEELRATAAMLQAQARILAEERNEAQRRLREMEDQLHFAMGVIKRLERERDEARILAQWFYTRLKQVCLDNPLRENWGGILARLEEAVLDDPWLEDAK